MGQQDVCASINKLQTVINDIEGSTYHVKHFGAQLDPVPFLTDISTQLRATVKELRDAQEEKS